MERTEYDTRVGAYAVIVDESDRMLLSWFNGGGWGGTPGWTLPGGGVEFEETLEEAVVREVFEETGYRIEVGAPLATDTVTGAKGRLTGRPYKSVRVLFSASIVGGDLGTTELDGTTSHADWLPIDDLPIHGNLGARFIEVALAARRRTERMI